MIKKLIPDFYYKSIYEIPYNKLYEDGIRLILTDLDNTLISYKETMPNEKLLEWKRSLIDMGFEIVIVSNSRKDRVTNFADALGVKCVKFSTKPLKRGIKKAIKKRTSRKYNRNEIILFGDQLMTDVFGGKRCKLKVALIEAVDKKTDTFPTRFNRKLENFFLKKIKRKYPDRYSEVLKRYVEGTDDSKEM
ncbi:MAG: YqeG family HAD IIIA-type phosphatase [Erysipelotrichaceae bacterium]|nr:YqeG family HAD IIIA-type phosphatase [Erysipelotrichaceae bacterium]